MAPPLQKKKRWFNISQPRATAWSLLKFSALFFIRFAARVGAYVCRIERPLPLLPPIIDGSIKRFPLPRLLLPRLFSPEAASLPIPVCLTTSLMLSDASRRRRTQVSLPSVAPCALPQFRDCRASTAALSRSQLVPIGVPWASLRLGSRIGFYFGPPPVLCLFCSGQASFSAAGGWIGQ